MYYSRYFEGNVGADSYTDIYAPSVTDKTLTTAEVSGCGIKLRMSVIGDAIADTLKDCGLDAKYNVDAGYLYLDYDNSNIGFYIIPYGSGNSGLKFNEGFNNSSSSGIYGYNTQSGGNGITYSWRYSPFKTDTYNTAIDYKFCVTVRGDTKNMFTIYLGQYSNPTALTSTIGTFYFGKDKSDDSDLFGYYMGANPGSNVHWIYVSNLLPAVYDGSSKTSPLLLVAATKLTMPSIQYNDKVYVVLIEQYMTNAAFIAMDDVYIDPGFNDSGQFYEIDGETYFCYTPYFIKCTTEVTPGQGGN